MTAKNMEAVEKGLDVLHPLDDYEAARKRRVSADHSLVAATSGRSRTLIEGKRT